MANAATVRQDLPLALLRDHRLPADLALDGPQADETHTRNAVLPDDGLGHGRGCRRARGQAQTPRRTTGCEKKLNAAPARPQPPPDESLHAAHSSAFASRQARRTEPLRPRIDHQAARTVSFSRARPTSRAPIIRRAEQCWAVLHEHGRPNSPLKKQGVDVFRRDQLVGEFGGEVRVEGHQE